MNIDHLNIIEQLERLAAAFPWDRVQLEITRDPEGVLEFRSYVSRNEKFGFPSIYSWSDNPIESVDKAIREGKDRDPEICRKKKIAELQDQIAKLQAVVIGLPPYRPNRELTFNVPSTVDV